MFLFGAFLPSFFLFLRHEIHPPATQPDGGTTAVPPLPHSTPSTADPRETATGCKGGRRLDSDGTRLRVAKLWLVISVIDDLLFRRAPLGSGAASDHHTVARGKTPVIQPGTVSTTNGFLDPLVRRMPTAPRKLGNKPRVKANVLRDVPVVPSMILSKKAPVTTGHLRVN